MIDESMEDHVYYLLICFQFQLLRIYECFSAVALFNYANDFYIFLKIDIILYGN